MAELCLVTGGAGFIGSHLVEALTASGRRVRVLDDFDTGLRENLEHIRPAPEIVTGDVGDAAAVLAATAGTQVVYHLAALASVQRSVETPGDTHRVCTTGTLNVLDSARRQGLRRVVFAGSSSAYGDVSRDEPLSEETPLQPLSTYAAAKLAGEFYAMAFTKTYGLETVRLRFFNVFGPRQRADSPYSGVIALFLAALTSGRTPKIFGDGLQSRDFVYVSNVVQALMLAAEKPAAVGKVYNVGAGKSVTLLELLNTLNRLLGTNITAQHAPARSGDVRFSQADISKARQDLGYEPMVSFEAGLAKTLEWFRQRS